MPSATETSNEDLQRRNSETALVKVEAPGHEGMDVESERRLARRQATSRSLRKWTIRTGILILLVAIVGFFIWRNSRPTAVATVQPKLAPITETVASSGRVTGTTETLVGAQAQGVVDKLYVDEGARVKAGQTLAVLKNDVAEAQVTQAQQAVQTAQAQLAQTARGPLASELEAATAQARQAEAQVTQQRAAIAEAQKNVVQQQAQLKQVQAQQELASKTLERTRTLAEQGIVPRAELDQAQTDLRVAQERVAAQRQAIETAQANVRQARASLQAAQANAKAQQAKAQTVQSGARPEDVQVARRRLSEAEEALNVARRQAANSVVTAPFAGLVTAINAELGQSVGANGVLKLVSGELEIHVDVDENNLADLKLGQSALISSSTFAGSAFEGSVTELGAAVDVSRGTIEVTVTPSASPDWLRPGQTVNVNIITAKNVQRLLLPATALTRSGDQTVVFVVANGIALEKPVVTRAATEAGVPVLAGLTGNEQVIVDAGKITAGERVRVNKG
ncbi:MAG TPA: efflux RND transporter periplasmic adaptor subunit [Pyrinomonadaceae bacterium]|nr:efflux RND transporter periplasmic adaptor subunit [Pyrinomonadaceae bacterium]